MENIIQVRVRYKETDQAGRVYHANYFVWLDMGRTEFLRALGFPYNEMENKGFYLAVTEASCNYIKSPNFDDIVNIKTILGKVGKASIDFTYEITSRDNNVFYATAYTKLACLDENGKPIKLPEEVLSKLVLDG
jgi:acyl-CoA thioester hydrolase